MENNLQIFDQSHTGCVGIDNWLLVSRCSSPTFCEVIHIPEIVGRWPWGKAPTQSWSPWWEIKPWGRLRLFYSNLAAAFSRPLVDFCQAGGPRQGPAKPCKRSKIGTEDPAVQMAVWLLAYGGMSECRHNPGGRCASYGKQPGSQKPKGEGCFGRDFCHSCCKFRSVDYDPSEGGCGLLLRDISDPNTPYNFKVTSFVEYLDVPLGTPIYPIYK